MSRERNKEKLFYSVLKIKLQYELQEYGKYFKPILLISFFRFY